MRIRRIASLCVALALLVSGTAFAKRPPLYDGLEGSVTEYIYPTGEPGEAGIPIEAMGETGIMAVTEPGPTPPTDKFAWVLPSTVTVLADTFNTPRNRTGVSTDCTVHTGIDGGNSTTQRIYSAYGGQVTLANPTYDTSIWGSLSQIKHPSATSYSYMTWYGHWSDWEDALVPVGTTYPSVTRGQAVGYVGNGGGVVEVHLHFSVSNTAGQFVSPAPYFSLTNPVPPSKMEFIVHTPVIRYTVGSALSIPITSGRPDQVNTVFPPVIKYRAKGTTTYSTGIMVKSGDIYTFVIPGSFTATCTTGLQYYIRVYRVYHSTMNKHDDNYTTRPVYGAHVDPQTPYTATPW